MARNSANAFAQPWARAAGLFVGCATTVVGSVRGVAPTELLLRVAVSSIVTGMIVRLFVQILKTAAAQPADED